MTDPRVIYEEKSFAVIEKPAGLIVHRPRLRKVFSGESALTDWLTRQYPEIAEVGDDPTERPGIVHRLDKETSGLLIIPRTEDAFRYFKAQFQARAILKTYTAIVHGECAPEGIIDAPIGIKDGSVKRSVHSKKFSKPAVTRYRTRNTFQISGEKFSELEVRPETGRTHQIRIHLKSIGHPIVGDPLYGKKNEPAGAARMFLHAQSVEFEAPDGRRMHIDSETPEEFLKFEQDAI